MKFTEPPADKTLHVRFLRYRDDIEVPDGWVGYSSHLDLLDQLRVTHPAINTELRVHPDRFDAGFIYHDSRDPKLISVTGTSRTLRLPVAGHIFTSRECTVGLIRRECPSHEVDSRID